MIITLTPKTNIKAVLTVLMPYAAPAAVDSMAQCVREYCHRSVAGEQDWATESRARFEGMFDMACRLGQMTDFDARQVREFMTQIDFICSQQLSANRNIW